MNELEDYRRKIDALDEELLKLLGQRFGIVRAVGEMKSRENIAVVQSDRAQEVLDRVRDLALQNGLDPDFVQKMYEDMIAYAHRLENRIKEQHATA